MSGKEGFICPECFKNFSSAKFLQDHFQQVHINGLNEPSESNGFLGVFRKARKTAEEIFDIKETNINFIDLSKTSDYCDSPEQSQSDHSYAYYEEPNKQPQALGAVVDKSEEFFELRRKKLCYLAASITILLIRLEKLLSYSKNSQFKNRKSFEQSLVEWIKDDLVSRCPSCGDKFGVSVISYRSSMSPFHHSIAGMLDLAIESINPVFKLRHHCRLCGGIICEACSYMLSSTEASRIIFSLNAKIDGGGAQANQSLNILWKEGSQNSLDSVRFKLNSDNSEYNIRFCQNCKDLLEVKLSQTERQTYSCDIMETYKELTGKMSAVLNLIPKFEEMHASLKLGKMEYTYDWVYQMRLQIVNLCQEINVLGNHFKKKSISEENSRKGNLLSSIYRHSCLFLQEYLINLKELPSETDVNRLISERLEKIKECTTKEISRNKMSSMKFVSTVPMEKNDSGWAAVASKSAFASLNDNSQDGGSDELKIITSQIENVCNYIDTARLSGRFDDVEILERNLQDLDLEYKRLYQQSA